MLVLDLRQQHKESRISVPGPGPEPGHESGFDENGEIDDDVSLKGTNKSTVRWQRKANAMIRRG